MKDVQEFIEKTIEGGWKLRGTYEFNSFQHEMMMFEDSARSPQILLVTQREILLDPLAWQAVGRIEGWDENEVYSHFMGMSEFLWHGKTIEEFIKTL